MNRIYLDNAATTSLSPEVLEAMLPALRENWGNPSSIHKEGRTARRAVEEARKQVAALLNADFRQIFFTGGGSESDNWALKGVAFARQKQGRHIITSAIEHHAILHTCDWLEKQGFEVTRLPVTEEGFVTPESLGKAIREDTTLVSVMLANNEIGTLQPIRQLADIAHAHGALMHTDAVQAVGAIPVDVNALDVDLLSLSGHKLHGPKGIGALYLRKGLRLDNLIHGGAQERGFRAGTENVPGIVGLGKACELAMASLETAGPRIAALRDRLTEGLLRALPGVRVNGSMERRLPNNCNLAFAGVEGEALLLRLDLAGIAASSGSACTSGSLDPSHVLTAIGLSPEMTNASLRMTLGTDTTEAEIDTVLRVLPDIVRNLRELTGWKG